MIRKYALYIAWIIAIIGTLGSLFFGEFQGNEPCPLCWYQRVCLYPLVFLLAVAAYKNDTKVWHYLIYQVVLGMLFSFYQLIKDFLPAEAPLCGGQKACSSATEAFAGISFPFLSFIAFTLILFLILFPKEWEDHQ